MGFPETGGRGRTDRRALWQPERFGRTNRELAFRPRCGSLEQPAWREPGEEVHGPEDSGGKDLESDSEPRWWGTGGRRCTGGGRNGQGSRPAREEHTRQENGQVRESGP